MQPQRLRQLVLTGARPLALVILAFTSLFLVTGDDGAPGGHLFALLCIYVVSRAGGTIATLARLPPLLGMLCAGLALGNLPVIEEHVGAQVKADWSSAIRALALVLILSRAGLAFDAAAFKRLRFVVMRLALLPCFAEAAVAAGLAAALLGFPLPWSFLLGFVVAAISPAVVVPGILSLQEQGYGTSTGISTMVVAAAPLDDVLSIAGFGICLSFTIESGSGSDGLWFDILKVPLEIIAGVAAGCVGAALLVLLLPVADVKQRSLGAAAMLFGVAVTSAFALKLVGFSGGSALSVLVMAVATLQGWGGEAAKPVSTVLAHTWNCAAQPLLFGLVGSSARLDTLQPRVVGLGATILLCSGVVRFGTAYLAVGFHGLRWQDKVFTACAWVPKATVQAAIGGIALDEATSEREKEMARQVLAIAVLSILCTAPVGAVLIGSLGPRLLLQDGGSRAKDVASVQGAVPVHGGESPKSDDPEAVTEVTSGQKDEVGGSTAQLQCCVAPGCLARLFRRRGSF